MRESWFQGEQLADLADARRSAASWCRDVAGTRVHGTTRRVPREHYLEVEKAQMLPAPVDAFDVPLWTEAKVHLDHHIQVQRALYSVATRFIGRTVRVRSDRELVRVYLGATLIKTHPRKQPGERSLVDDGRLAEIRAGSGHLALATDLVALGALFDLSWKAVSGKTAVDRVQVDRASLLGTDLLVALGAKDHVANRVTPESIDTRNRAFTLLVRAYDSARHALAYLRWEEGDVDQVAPSLYQRSRRRAAPAAPSPVDSQPGDGGDEDSATPSSGLAATGTE